jgi:hypothetical protein
LSDSSVSIFINRNKIQKRTQLVPQTQINIFGV